MMDPRRLKLKRHQIKECLTQLETWVDTFSFIARKYELEVRLKMLRKYEEKFEEVQNQLEDVDVMQLAPEVTERIDFYERVSVLEAKLLELEHSFNKSPVSEQVAESGKNFPWIKVSVICLILICFLNKI